MVQLIVKQGQEIESTMIVGAEIDHIRTDNERQSGIKSETSQTISFDILLLVI